MERDEHDRDAVRRALAEVVGHEVADQLMESVPPFPWHDVARQPDLVALQSDLTDLRADVTKIRADVTDLRADVTELQVDIRVIRETLDLRFDSLRDGLAAQFHADLLAHSRLMFFSMLGAVFTAASLAFAAVRF